MYIGSGFLVDRWGTRVSLAVFMAFWSISNMLHAFARTAFQLGVFRALLGIGEPGNFMAGFKAISEWYPPREKGFVNGLQNAGRGFRRDRCRAIRGVADGEVRLANLLR